MPRGPNAVAQVTRQLERTCARIHTAGAPRSALQVRCHPDALLEHVLDAEGRAVAAGAPVRLVHTLHYRCVGQGRQGRTESQRGESDEGARLAARIVAAVRRRARA